MWGLLINICSTLNMLFNKYNNLSFTSFNWYKLHITLTLQDIESQ